MRHAWVSGQSEHGIKARMRGRSLRLAAATALAAGSLGGPATAYAANRVWSNTGGGSFQSGGAGGNWSGLAVPGAADSAIFDIGNGEYTVTFAANATNAVLEIGDDDVTLDLNTRTYTIGSALNGVQLATGAGNVARLTVTDGTLAASEVLMSMNGLGSNAIVTVTTGGVLSASGDIQVGWADRGTLTVERGGDVAVADEFAVAKGIGTVGTVVLTDAGSTLSVSNVNGNVYIGDGGSASFTVRNGADVNTYEVSLGRSQGGSGSISIDGPGSTWTAAGDFAIGGIPGSTQGNGFVTVSDGGELTVAGANNDLLINSTGTLTINGGTVTANGLFNAGTLNFNAGTINLTRPGNAFAVATNGLFGNKLILTAGKTINVTNSADVSSGAVLLVDGGTFGAGSLFLSGELHLASQASTVNANALNISGLLSGDGRITGKITNNATGDVRANAGQRLLILDVPAQAHINNGRFTLLGGTLEFRNALPLANASTGQIHGQGTLMTGTGGLLNNGRITFSGGASNVFGQLTNATPVAASPSKVLVTGGGTATFYNTVTLEAGSTFQVSANSHAVFLGAINAAAGTLIGPGTKYFEGTANIASLVTNGSTVVEQVGVLTTNYVREESLLVRGRANLRTLAAGGDTSRLASLEIEKVGGAWAGKLDLADSALVIDYDGASPINDVRSMILGGYAGGTWTGAGILSTASAAHASTGIGYGEASAILGALGGTFRGQSADGTSLLLRHTLRGDANLSGQVDFDDLLALAQNYGQASGKHWSHGDGNYDGAVNFDDLLSLAQNYGQSPLTADAAALGGEDFAADWALALSLVPEPTCALAAAAAAALGIRRRGRHRPMSPSDFRSPLPLAGEG